jgi:hypothetical protein
MRAPPRRCSGAVTGSHDVRHDRLHTVRIELTDRPCHPVESTALHPEPARCRAGPGAGRSVPPPHAKVTRCPGGSGCHGVAGSAWYASAQRVGAGIVHGNGFSASAYVGVVAFRSPRGARRFVHHVRHEHARYNGVFSVALKPGRGGHYQPGERGVGSLAPVHRHGWSGWVLDMQHSYTFWDGSESAEQLTRKFLASRGRYVCAAFLDARSVSELRHYVPAWGRLVAALGG